MKSRWHIQLGKELRQAGASAAEVRKLMPVADKLTLLRTTGAKDGLSMQNLLTRALKPALLVSSGVIVGMVIVVFSQSVSPTSWLYPVQQLSDNTATMVHPEYRATVMMRRARQVNELVANHASPKTIMATLASYSAEAADYKSMSHANYAAFDYCKTNLQQAAAAAPGSVRQAIINSLDSIKAT